MLHRRVHERNREISIETFKTKPGKGKLELSRSSPSNSPSMAREEASRWRNRADTRNRVISIRGRIEARRIRARSRWESISLKAKFGDNSLSI